jgi:hypothetical protein
MTKGRLARLALVLGAALGVAASAAAQTTTPPPQTFSTTIYFDWTHFLTNGGPVTTVTGPGYKNDFFAFRRAYFTYENKVNDNLRFRFRLDADNTANLTSVDVKTGSTKKDDKLRLFMKHLYLQYDNLFPNTSFKVGMADTITFKTAEDRWGYRSVAKTLVDGFKDVTGVEVDATSADLGVSFSHGLSKYFRYQVQVTNGTHYSHAENDKWKKVMLQGQLVPAPGLSLVGYYDYEKQNPDAKAETVKVDGYFEKVRDLVLAAEYFIYRNDLYLTSAEAKYDVSGLSVFGRYTFTPDKLAAFARFDRYEPNSEVEDNELDLLIAGLDWTPFHTSWKLQPSIWYYSYADSTKKDDVVFNLTFFLSF